MAVATWACFTSCRAETQDAYSDGSSPHKSAVSDDPEEVFGESIDEDSQSVKPPNAIAPAPSTSGADLRDTVSLTLHSILSCQSYFCYQAYCHRPLLRLSKSFGEFVTM